jgi:hypothetical protein
MRMSFFPPISSQNSFKAATTSVMPLAFYIIRQDHTNFLKPMLKHREIVLSTQQPAISSPDRNYTWATLHTTLPSDSSTYVTFDVAIDKQDGNDIIGCEVHWDVFVANKRVAELATEEMVNAAGKEVEYEFEAECKRNGKCASAHLRMLREKRYVC